MQLFDIFQLLYLVINLFNIIHFILLWHINFKFIEVTLDWRHIILQLLIFFLLPDFLKLLLEHHQHLKILRVNRRIRFQPLTLTFLSKSRRLGHLSRHLTDINLTLKRWNFSLTSHYLQRTHFTVFGLRLRLEPKFLIGLPWLKVCINRCDNLCVTDGRSWVMIQQESTLVFGCWWEVLLGLKVYKVNGELVVLGLLVEDWQGFGLVLAQGREVLAWTGLLVALGLLLVVGCVAHLVWRVQRFVVLVRVDFGELHLLLVELLLVDAGASRCFRLPRLLRFSRQLVRGFVEGSWVT